MTSLAVARILLLATASASLAACGELSADDPEAESTIAERDAITSGTTALDNSMHVGALYHKWTNPSTHQVEWYPRPCSAVRVTVDGWYLTARHCITDGDVGDPLLAANQIKVSERRGPGLSPPSDAKTANAIADSPEVPRLDVALVWVPGTGYQGAVTQGQLAGFYLPNATYMTTKDVMAMGYGRSLNNQPDVDGETTPASGAGTLRSGLLHVVSGWKANAIWFSGYEVKPNSSGQITNHGDSGGPDFLEIKSGSTVIARLQTGVHIYSDATADPDSRAQSLAISEPKTFQWITSTLAKFYVKRLQDANGSSATYLDVKNNSSAAQTPVWTYALTDTRAQHWTYNIDTKAIRNENGKCLDIQWNGTANGTPVWMWDCTGGTAQQWSFTDSMAIKNVNGKCLDVPGGVTQQQLQIWDCLNNSNQQFLLTAAP